MQRIIYLLKTMVNLFNTLAFFCACICLNNCDLYVYIVYWNMNIANVDELFTLLD